MSRRYEDDRFRTQNSLNQGKQNQRAQSQKYQSEDVRKAPYQPGDIQRRQMEAREAQRRRAGNDVRMQRYQQETLAGDWQQDWDRKPYDYRNDKRFTAGQFVLVLIIVVLTAATAAMAVFWYTGRSSLKSPADSGVAVQQNIDQSVDDELPDDNIIILDND